ncbi:hypothetical protein B0H12DRAFT_1111428 [Mycena haematopus]|nr:hypothetical protein B0H12DRAFT_1111428 [Mycena haematopus]
MLNVLLLPPRFSAAARFRPQPTRAPGLPVLAPSVPAFPAHSLASKSLHATLPLSPLLLTLLCRLVAGRVMLRPSRWSHRRCPIGIRVLSYKDDVSLYMKSKYGEKNLRWRERTRQAKPD